MHPYRDPCPPKRNPVRYQADVLVTYRGGIVGLFTVGESRFQAIALWRAKIAAKLLDYFVVDKGFGVDWGVKEI